MTSVVVTMPSQMTSPPLTVTMLAALWVSLGRCDVSEFLGPRCDNGKLSLERDLPGEAAFWDCPVNERPSFSQMHPSVDTVHDPEPARQICMDKSISYKHAIPNSGAYRPVRAESGEYLYCPPQRWLNNLHHAATVLLYHPCAPADERLLLSALARACLHDYIITPHPQLKCTQIALVSWGRTLELSTLASSDVCDWLDATASTRRNEFDAVTQRLKYSLLLTKSAEQLQQHHTDWGSLRQCCEQTISSLLIGGTQSELNVKPEHLKQVQDEGKSRKIRAALTEKQGHFQDEHKKEKTVEYDSSFLNNQTNRATFNRTGVYHNSSLPGSRNLSDPLGPRDAEPQSKQNVMPELTSRPTTLPWSDVSETMLRTHSPESQKRRQRPETPAQHFNFKPTVLAGGVNSKYNHTARTEDMVLRSKDEGTEHVKEAKYKQKQTVKDSTANGMEDNEVVDVKEREVERGHRHEDSHPYHKSEETQSASKLESQPQSGAFLPSSRNCDGCKADERCECDATSGVAEARAPTLNNGLPRTPRTDEAVWAAAALGFLLILLTLSILHTRLYRHWRTAPSLYWHDPQLDYDSVADVIRRRLRIVKRRQKRSRRQECVLLPSSSSSDEHI